MVALAKQKTKAQQPVQSPTQPIVWISSEEAAKRIGIEPKTLVNWRSSQKEEQPPFYKPPGRGSEPRYDLQEVDEWIKTYKRDFKQEVSP